jgi:uncharacterized protein (UPF0261 family)
MYSVTDVAGINRVSRVVLGNAARAIAGMVSCGGAGAAAGMAQAPMPALDELGGRPIGRVLTKMGKVTREQVIEALTRQKEAGGLLGEVMVRMGRVTTADVDRALLAQKGIGSRAGRGSDGDRPAIGLTMFGVTTPCVTAVRKALEGRYDCLTFHATGTGGQAMEKLVESGLIDGGVIDVTTTEVADLIVGGVFACSPSRFEAILEKGIPYVLSVGALDMVNFGARASGPFVLLIPEKGVSSLDAPGQAFWDPEADAALFDGLEVGIERRAGRAVRRLPYHLNDPQFADALVAAFLDVARAAPP